MLVASQSLSTNLKVYILSKVSQLHIHKTLQSSVHNYHASYHTIIMMDTEFPSKNCQARDKSCPSGTYS